MTKKRKYDPTFSVRVPKHMHNKFHNTAKKLGCTKAELFKIMISNLNNKEPNTCLSNLRDLKYHNELSKVSIDNLIDVMLFNNDVDFNGMDELLKELLEEQKEINNVLTDLLTDIDVYIL